MKPQTKLKLRSEKGSVHGKGVPAPFLDSSFSLDDSSQERSQSVPIGLPVPFPMVSSLYAPFAVALPPVSLQEFKTRPCSIRGYHDHKQCPYYHSLKDKRRPPCSIIYEPEPCPNAPPERPCIRGDSCPFSHNKVEIFYHPSRYKKKMCGKRGLQGGCEYGRYCSFAHTESDLKIELLHRLPKTPDFFRYKYKTVYCPFTHVHDKAACVYAHNVQDYRRNPKTTAYKAETCKKWNAAGDISMYADGGCNYNEACNRCHGWKELEYHPKFYKTRPCANGEECTRVDCGYLHPGEEPPLETESSTNKTVKTGEINESMVSLVSQSKDGLVTNSSLTPLHKSTILGRLEDTDDHTDLDSNTLPRLANRSHARTEVDLAQSKEAAGKLNLLRTPITIASTGQKTVCGDCDRRYECGEN